MRDLGFRLLPRLLLGVLIFLGAAFSGGAGVVVLPITLIYTSPLTGCSTER